MMRRSLNVASVVALPLMAGCSGEAGQASETFSLPPSVAPGSAQVPAQMPGDSWREPDFPKTEAAPDDLRVKVAPLTQVARAERLVVDRLGGFAVVGVSTDSAAVPVAWHVSRYDQGTSLSWQRNFSCAGQLSPRISTLMTRSGSTLVAGGFAGACNFGLGDVQSTVNPAPTEPWPELGGSEFDTARGQPSSDAFVVELEHGGDIQRHTLVQGLGEQFASALYMTSKGDAAVLGEFQGAIELEGERYVSSGGARAEAFSLDLVDDESVAARHLAVNGVYFAAEGSDGELILSGVGEPPGMGEWASTDRLGWVMSVGDERASWALRWDPPVAPVDMETDADGNTYLLLAGLAPVFASADSPIESAPDSTEGMVLLKVTSSGEIDWKLSAEGSVTRASLAISDDGVAVFGSFQGALSFGDDQFVASATANAFAWFVDVEGEDQFALAVADGIHSLGLDIVENPAGGWLGLWWAGDFYDGLSASVGYHALWFRFGE